MAGEALFVLFALAMFVLFAIVLPIWTYNDAQRNSSHSGLLWALVVFFGGIIGILLYFIIGRDQTGPGGAASTY
ncbi:PLDc N-terminal domain-containing protein [Haloarchaeobius amylolyticus]|uniref:PLDc N-terminal domain-containing protein n=1 Tax=Haloarchaeobius amylolyticus TaxID=1198296 RepID=UPI00226EEC75|nr:PLDc N-terminal domain-containing protein [Haloarchaeobius amylolyticus]